MKYYFLQKFLLLDELKKESHLERADSVEPGDCYISINNITGKWDPVSYIYLNFK